MKPYLLKVPLMRKEPEIHFDTCQVDHVITLSEPAFLEFQHNLMTDRDFLREFNREYASSYTEGVRPGLLVLGEGSDDGIFVCTEGYDYARYSAYVPNARQILLLKEFAIVCGSPAAPETNCCQLLILVPTSTSSLKEYAEVSECIVRSFSSSVREDSYFCFAINSASRLSILSVV